MAKTWKVVGYKPVSYFSTKKKEQVNGSTVYLSRDISGDGPDCFGCEVKEVWLSYNRGAVYKPSLDDVVCIMYNDRGYVDDLMSYAY